MTVHENSTGRINKQDEYDVVILGGGPSGLTAAIYTSRALLKTLVLAGSCAAGQLATTTEVENYPGFPEGIHGPELIERFRKQAVKFGSEIVEQHVEEIEGSFEERFVLTTEKGKEFKSRSIIIATGASAKWLGLESEQRLRGKGVSACATCDAFFFRDKEVAVIGAGDAAMEESIFLTRFASKVHVLVRRSKSEIKASKIMQERALKNPKIMFHFHTELEEVLGEDKVSGIKVIDNQTNETTIFKDVEGVFLAIGHRPNTAFLEDFIDLDEKGYIKVTNDTHSSAKGVFVSGDVADLRYRQAITAAGFGCMAAIDLEHFLTINN